MSLEYASEHAQAAVRLLANSELPLADRLQTAWDDHVQMVWMKPCLTRDLLIEFRDLWHRYTAPSDDPHATKLRTLDETELHQAIDEVVAFSLHTAGVAAASPDAPLAKLSDL